MTRYIDADALLAWYDEKRAHELEIIRSADYHKERKDEARTTIATLDKVYFKVDELRSNPADVQEVKHGKWGNKGIDGELHCSLCGAYIDGHDKQMHDFHFCYNYGAKMDGKD